MTTVMKDSQEEQLERAHLCTKGNSCVLAARQLERSIHSLGGLQGQGYIRPVV